jgi:predicted transcriptional regulator
VEAVLREFGELETAVMERLWSWRRPVTVREVVADLRRVRPIAYTTVMTVMDNLHHKGVLDRDRRGRAYLYRPTEQSEEHSARLMAEILDASTDRTATLKRLVATLPPGEVTRLRKLLDQQAAPRATA